MMTPDEMIKVIEAAKDGGEIEECVYCQNTWKEWDGYWCFSVIKYRIKPVPVVGYINMYGLSSHTYIHASRESADRYVDPNRTGCIRIEYTEGQFDE